MPLPLARVANRSSWLLLTVALSAGGASVLRAQVPTDTTRRAADSVSADTLLARLARAEAAIALLREQLAGEAETAVHMRSRFHVELSASVLTNLFATYGRVNNADVPQTALADVPSAVAPPSDDAVGVSVRQTRFGAAVSARDVLGGLFTADIDFDLFGGAQTTPGGRRLFPEPRLRTTRARLAWGRTELMVGSDTPLISDLNPLSLASVGTPDFSGAGNLWNWLGQVRVTREVASFGAGDARRVLLVQGAVMSPTASQVAPNDIDGVDIGERSRRPAVEARIALRWAPEESGASSALLPDRGGEIAIGAHRGWVAVSPGGELASSAVSADARVALAPGLELRGEGYAGRLLRGLGGGGIAQNFGAPRLGAPADALGAPVRDVAGWLQVNVQPHPTTIAGGGCGIDVTNADDAAPRRQNTACAVHLDWRPAQPLVLGVEYREIGTRFADGTARARHLNLVFGFEL